jgi:hypothetical protein
LVANSPGLIAGSYVLHRLLVPRHPPIALSSLSHNKKLQRCSRPLCSSQNTGRNTNPKPPLPSGNTQHRGKNTPHPDIPTRSLVKAGPSHTTTPTTIHKDYQSVQQGDPEKPEQPETSRPARFLRTQQRASIPHPLKLTFHTHTPKKEAPAVLARSTRIRT